MYNERVNSFRLCWVSLGWKPALWVHWVCAHSSYYIKQHSNLYVFSSLPTERRHQGFKLDLRHAFQGWKVASPIVAARFLRTVVENDALDLSMTALAGAKQAFFLFWDPPRGGARVPPAGTPPPGGGPKMVCAPRRRRRRKIFLTFFPYIFGAAGAENFF